MKNNSLNKKLNLIINNEKELAKWKIELFKYQIESMESYFNYMSNELKWIFIQSNDESFKNMNVLELINNKSGELMKFERLIRTAKSNLEEIIENNISINIDCLIDTNSKAFRYIKDSRFWCYAISNEDFISLNNENRFKGNLKELFQCVGEVQEEKFKSLLMKDIMNADERFRNNKPSDKYVVQNEVNEEKIKSIVNK